MSTVYCLTYGRVEWTRENTSEGASGVQDGRQTRGNDANQGVSKTVERCGSRYMLSNVVLKYYAADNTSRGRVVYIHGPLGQRQTRWDRYSVRHIFHAERWLSEQGLLSLEYYTRGRPWSDLAIGIVTLDIFFLLASIRVCLWRPDRV